MVKMNPEQNNKINASNPGFHSQHFFIQSGSIRLEAKLQIPQDGNNLKSAVVFLPGSGVAPFQNYIPGFFEHFIEGVFLPRDICVLYINKRGVGASEGDWQKNDFQGRADDVYAAFLHLQQHPQIDPDRIGLIGHSQGGWIANLAASQHEEIAFFISLAGPTTTVQEQIRHTVENDLACRGLKGKRLTRRLGWQMFQSKAGAAIGRIFPIGELGFIAGILYYDPREVIKSVCCPGLFVFAEFDSMVPPKENLQRFAEMWGDNFPEHLSTVVIPGADHLFNLTDTVCFDWEQSIRKPHAAALVQVLRDWLTAHSS
jgi:pimeloyl-ACP methyl ester carboxylesterase